MRTLFVDVSRRLLLAGEIESFEMSAFHSIVIEVVLCRSGTTYFYFFFFHSIFLAIMIFGEMRDDKTHASNDKHSFLSMRIYTRKRSQII